MKWDSEPIIFKLLKENKIRKFIEWKDWYYKGIKIRIYPITYKYLELILETWSKKKCTYDNIVKYAKY